MRKLKKKKRILSVVMAICMMSSMIVGVEPLQVSAASAAKYEHLTISSGFNADVVATSSDSGSMENYRNTASLDSAGTAASRACFYSSSYSKSSGYLPDNNIIVDCKNSALTWKLGSYTSNNVLKLGKGGEGTLVFEKTGCYQNIYLLSVCGGVQGGDTSMKAKVNYTDGTTDEGSFTVLDWFTEADMQATKSGVYRRINNGSLHGTALDGPMFTKSTIQGLDTSKVVKSITVYNTGKSSEIYLSVFAATGLTADVEVPSPSVDVNAISGNQCTVNWAPTTNATSYRIDVAKDSSFSSMLPEYNNKEVNGTSCEITGLDRNTTYYYRVRAVNNSGGQSASSNYGTITTPKSEVRFNDNGGSNGPQRTDLNDSWKLPDRVDVPTRRGYTFKGYYSALINGTRYYDERGNRAYDTSFEENCPSEINLYAQWKINSYTITLDENGGTVEGPKTYTKKYNESVEIMNPVHPEEGVTFQKWVLLDSEGKASTNGTLVKGAGYTTYIFGSDSTDVTLKASWSFPDDSRVVVTGAVKQSVSASYLEDVYDHEVTDPEMGITTEDLAAVNKEVVLTVDRIEVNEEEETPETIAPIENILEGSSNESLTYYDISVKKIIDEKTTYLKEIPVPVKIQILLTGELADRTGYSVYRIHEGVVERMSSSRSSTEYYEVDGDIMTIYTRKFSTYAITASNSVIGEYEEEELNDTNNWAATDVQGRYVDSTGTRVYKVDVEWGAMKFVFNKHQKWNPDTHSYSDEIRIVLDDSAYAGGNNEIVISNHSNADVRVGMAVVEKDIDGVEIYLKRENSNDSADAVDMPLNKVANASGTAAAEQVRAFVRLDEGMLNAEGLSKLMENGNTNVFQQIARVVITIEAIQDSETTPMYYGD